MVLIKRPVVYSVEFHEDLFNIAIYTFLKFGSKSSVDFKVRNGYSIWVFDHFVLYPSMTGSLIHLLGRDKLNEAPDEGWQPLFEK